MSTRAALIIADRTVRAWRSDTRALQASAGRTSPRQLRGRTRAQALTVAAACYRLHDDDTIRATVALQIVRDAARAARAPMPHWPSCSTR